MRVKFVTVLLLVLSTSLAGENIRGRYTGTITGDGASMSFKPEEIVVIEAGNAPEFQDGIELRLEIPPALKPYQNSFALLVFRDVQPSPMQGTLSYQGNRVYMRLIPSRDAMFVRIPFDSSHSIEGDAFTDVLPMAIKPQGFPLLVTVLPVMKGIPNSALNQLLDISITAIWKDEGRITINLTNTSGDPNEKVTIVVDGQPVSPEKPVTVDAGLHRILISSTHAPTVERTVAVEPGGEEQIDVELDYRPPEVRITIPDGAALLIDGTPVNVTDSVMFLQIESGNHEVTFQLGDFEVSRPFTVLPGSQVGIELMIDVDIVEFGNETGNPFGSGSGDE